MTRNVHGPAIWRVHAVSHPEAAPRHRTHTRPLRLGTALTVAVLLGSLALSACSRGPAEDPNGYFGQTADRMVYVEWTRSSGAATGASDLQGSATLAVIDSKAFDVSAESSDLSGTLKGSDVSLTLHRALDSSTAWTGTLVGATLTLSYTDGSGQAVSLSLRSASRPTFNAALVKQQQDLATLKEGNATAKSEAELKKDIDKWGAAVQKDMDTLTKDVDATTAAVGAVTAANEAAKSDAAVATYDFNQAVGHKWGPQICPWADKASGAANSASAEASIAASGKTHVDDLAAIVRKDIARLTSDDSKLAAAQSALTIYKPKKVPSAKKVANAISSANSAISDAQHTANGASTAASSKAASAQSLASRSQSKCASAPQSNPSPHHQ